MSARRQHLKLHKTIETLLHELSQQTGENARKRMSKKHAVAFNIMAQQFNRLAFSHRPVRPLTELQLRRVHQLISDLKKEVHYGRDVPEKIEKRGRKRTIVR